MYEDKEAIVKGLLPVLQMTRAGADIVGLKYERSSGFETVIVTYANSYEKHINVSCDSGVAMIQDICRKIV